MNAGFFAIVLLTAFVVVVALIARTEKGRKWMTGEH